MTQLTRKELDNLTHLDLLVKIDLIIKFTLPVQLRLDGQGKVKESIRLIIIRQRRRNFGEKEYFASHDEANIFEKFHPPWPKGQPINVSMKSKGLYF